MQSNINPLVGESYYHIYNRGVNGENLFKEEKNYDFFLNKYATYIDPIVETYAYCLLKNHFHLLIRTKSENEILSFYNNKNADRVNKNKTASEIISLQFSHLFNSYSQSINKSNNRSGALFERPFRRILVNSDTYFTKLIHYIHYNPQKHDFVSDFKEYQHSSYHSHLSKKTSKIKREEVINWFGNKSEYINLHNQFHPEKDISKLIFN